MRKIIIFTLLLILLFSLQSDGKAKSSQAMLSFLGVEWRDTAAAFLEKVQAQSKPLHIGKGSQFYLKQHKMADSFVDITFIFSEGKSAIEENDYDKIFLEKVSIRFEHKDFNKIFKYFKKMYGGPREHKWWYLKFVVRNKLYERPGSSVKVKYQSVYWRDISIGREITIKSPDIQVTKTGQVSAVDRDDLKYSKAYLTPLVNK